MSLSAPQQQLLNVIAASQQPETRVQAEAQLDQYATSFPGYSLLLASLCGPSAAPLLGEANQLLAAILMKQYVAKHWTTACEAFVEPAVPANEKQALYPILLPLLGTDSRKLRNQFSAMISDIADWDFPENWKTLLPDILTILGQAANAPVDAPHGVHTNLLNGCMQVLVNFCESMTDEQLTSTIPQLFPILLQLCQKKFEIIMSVQRSAPLPQLTPAQTQAVVDALQFCIYALDVYRSCLDSVLQINELVNSEVRVKTGKKKSSALDKIVNDFLLPTLNHWISFITSIVTMPSNSGAQLFALAYPLSWGLRCAAVQTLFEVQEKFEPQIMSYGVDGARQSENAVNVLIETAQALLPLYERRVLNARVEGFDESDAAEDAEEDIEDAYDEEGNCITMSSFLYEIFAYFTYVLRIAQPKKAAAKKKGAAKTSPEQPSQLAWKHLVSLFNSTASGSLLSRILQLCLSYGQLSSREIASSLGHVEEFLSFQAENDEVAAQQINVRVGVKELLLGCLLYHDDFDEDDEEAAELRAMGFKVGDDDDGKSGSTLVQRETVLSVLCPMLTSLLQQSAQLRSQNNRHWWKGRELATLLLAHIVHDIMQLSQPPAGGKGQKKKAAAAAPAPVVFDLQSFVRDVLLPDLSATQGNGTHPLLRTQTLISTSKFAPVFLKAKENNLVVMALEALIMNMTPQAQSSAAGASEADMLVRISAVNAFGSLCATIEKQVLLHNNILPMALKNICELVQAAGTQNSAVDESAVVKVLETLTMAVDVDENMTISAEPTITPLLLSAWSANATNHLISDGVTHILHRLLELTPATCISVQVKILPAVQAIFTQNESKVAVTGTVSAAMDLLKYVLLSVEKHTRTMKAAQGASVTVSPSAAGPSAAPEFLHPLLFSDLLPMALKLTLHTDDHTLIEDGTVVLTAFLRIDSAKVANCSVATTLPNAAAGSALQTFNGMQLLCIIINQFLNPTLDDRVADNVGNLIVQVVFSLSAQLGEANIKELIKAVVIRLYSAEYPPLIESLLLVFARLIHSSSAENIIGFLHSMGTLNVQKKTLIKEKKYATDTYASTLKTHFEPATVDALPFLISKWINAQKDIHAKYPSKVLYLALAQLMTYLFSSAAGVQALRNLECRGYVIVEKPAKGASSKRITRSQTVGGSASHEPQYTKIPLSTKLLQLFLQEWSEWDAKAKKAEKAAKRRARKAANAANGGDDDDDEFEDDDFEDDEDFEDDDEDFEDDDDDIGADDDFVQKMISKHGGRGGANKPSPFASADDFPTLGKNEAGMSKYMNLSDMLDHNAGDLDELDEELEDEVFPESATDPLNEIELGPYLHNFVQQFTQANGGAFAQEAAQWLDDKDRQLLDSVVKQPLTAPITPQKK